MMVADENIIPFDQYSSRTRSLTSRIPAGMVYAAQRMTKLDEDHDGRGLIIAILLCMVCWAALGYALLT